MANSGYVTGSAFVLSPRAHIDFSARLAMVESLAALVRWHGGATIPLQNAPESLAWRHGRRRETVSHRAEGRAPR